MAKVKILVRPLGGFNGLVWPPVGEVVELEDHIADSMAKSGNVEIVKDKPKPKADDKPKAETRPAAAKNVETRKG